jgi:hypothetical protein
MCETRGVTTPGTIVDHVRGHNNNEHEFWNGELQSLCEPCHCRKLPDQQRGFSKEIGIDGFPVDPRHPANVGSGTPIAASKRRAR